MATHHIGFDDTDSPRGGCTTYVAALLVEKLHKLGVVFNDYPNLIRLNPQVPWKTRGNGAVCLRISFNRNLEDKIYETVADTVEENSELNVKNTDPGIVFFCGAKIPREIRTFARKTIQNIVKMEHALKLVKKFKAEALGFETGYGIVGALAAIGETLDGDHTYEAIAYRKPENRGKQRRLNHESVEEMTRKTQTRTFNNIDPETKRILIMPRGPDPVLYGVRGETAEAVVEAHRMIKPLESVERFVVFRTNQGTDAHLGRVKTISDIEPYRLVIARGFVASSPKLIPKRHRVFSIKDETGSVDCAAYEPTGTLRRLARHLRCGDLVEACGGVKPQSTSHPLTINLEKLRVLKLAPKFALQNPRCSRCNKSMSSMGRGQGFRCVKCGLQSLNNMKIVVEQKRTLSRGLFITSPRSQRHLTKPLSRYGKEKVGVHAQAEKMIRCWHIP